MFFAILIVAIGVAILLNTMGIMSGNFWGFFWAAIFIIWGVKMMIRRGKCPMCGWHGMSGRIHDKIHSRMQDDCDCDYDCGHDHGAGESKHDEE
jgi:uncharacterized membrane protein